MLTGRPMAVDYFSSTPMMSLSFMMSSSCAVDLDLGARPLAEQHLVLRLQVEGDDLAALVAGAGADGDDLALLGLLGSGIGDDDAASRLGLAVDAADDHAVMQRTKLHGTKILLISRACKMHRPMRGVGLEGC